MRVVVESTGEATRVAIRKRGSRKQRVPYAELPMTIGQRITYMQKLEEMAKKEIGIVEEEGERGVGKEVQEGEKARRRGNKRRKKKSKRVTKQEAIKEKLERMEEEESGTVTEEYVTFGKPSLSPSKEEGEQNTSSAVEDHGGSKETEPKGMPMVGETEVNESDHKEEHKEEENIFDVPKSVKNVLEHLGGSFVGVVTPDGKMYQKIGDKYVKSIPPNVEVNDNQLIIKANMDVVKQYAMLAKGGKVAISVNIGNNRAIVNIYVDKEGHIYVPPTLKKYVHVEPNGTITLDILKVLPKYFVKRLMKKGGKLKINVAYYGKFAGFNAPVAGKTIEADIEPEG